MHHLVRRGSERVKVKWAMQGDLVTMSDSCEWRENSGGNAVPGQGALSLDDEWVDQVDGGFAGDA